MNIVEAYKIFNNKLIILISGLLGSNKSKIAQQLSKDLNISYINQKNHIKKDYNEQVSISYNNENNQVITATVPNMDSDDLIDFDSFNEQVLKHSNNGCVVSCLSAPSNKIKFKPDIHIHIKIPKDLYTKKRHDFLTKNKDTNAYFYDIINTNLEKAIIKKLVFPYYYKTIKDSEITKLFNIELDKYNETVLYDDIWNFIIDFIQKFINYFNNNKYNEWIKNNKLPNKSNSLADS